MRKLVVVVLTLSAMFAAVGQEKSNLGVGTQFTLPVVFGISARYWTTPTFGVEGDLFLLTTDGETWGMVGVRALGRLAAAELAGFYVAGGGSLYFPDRDTALSLCGGIELFLPFAPSLAVNIEFGFVWHQDAGFGMAFGSGIHFYFGR